MRARSSQSFLLILRGAAAQLRVIDKNSLRLLMSCRLFYPLSFSLLRLVIFVFLSSRFPPPLALPLSPSLYLTDAPLFIWLRFGRRDGLQTHAGNLQWLLAAVRTDSRLNKGFPPFTFFFFFTIGLWMKGGVVGRAPRFDGSAGGRLSCEYVASGWVGFEVGGEEW